MNRAILIGNGPSSWQITAEHARALMGSFYVVTMNMRDLPAHAVCLHDRPIVERWFEAPLDDRHTICFRKHLPGMAKEFPGWIPLDERLDGSSCGRSACAWAAAQQFEQITLLGFDGPLDHRTIDNSAGGHRSQHVNWCSRMVEDARNSARGGCPSTYRLALDQGGAHPLDALPAERMTVLELLGEVGASVT